MCTKNSDINFTSNVEEEDKKVEDICLKCKEGNAEFILRKRFAYCCDCFEQHFVHKFRSTIGKSKLIKNGEDILVAVSGSSSSCSMSYMIRDGLQEVTGKKLRFNPIFLYIDESYLDDGENKESKIVLDFMRNLNFLCYTVSFSQILLKGSIVLSLLKEVPIQKKNLNHQLRNLLESSSSTSEESLRQLLIKLLLVRCAKSLGIFKVFIGDSSNKISEEILVNIAQGRGHSVADCANFRNCFCDIEFYRPMKDILFEEIVFYQKMKGFCSISRNNKSSSIHSCTSGFLSDLQNTFPSTIPTVAGTGSKLVNFSPENEQAICRLCCSPVFNSQALIALNFSKQLTSKSSSDSIIHSDENLKENCEKEIDETEDNKKNTQNLLCHSCHIIFNDAKNKEKFYSFITQESLCS